MPPAQRAKQFAPFDALSGLQTALRRKEAEYLWTERRELSEDRKAELNQALTALQPGSLAAVCYYRQGEYVDVAGTVEQIDIRRQALFIEGQRIPLADLYAISAPENVSED